MKSTFQYRKRYEVTCDKFDGVSCIAEISFQYRKRYEVTCDGVCSCKHVHSRGSFQYRKRYEVTCDSVSGRPQKQKAQKVVLENLLESERLREFF